MDDVKSKADRLEEDGCRLRILHLDRIKRARKEAIPESEMERLALTFKVLGDPTRLKIVGALARGEMCVCDLAAYLGLSESAISHQLRRLREQSIVKPRRDGQVLYYALEGEHLAELLTMGLEHVRE